MSPERVEAVILTYNARASVQRCLAATVSQSMRPASILVVDNASAEPIDDLVAAYAGARVLRLADNIGPAGGYASGLTTFLDSDCDWAWVMDDDCVPAPDALEQLLATASPRRLTLSAMLNRDTGKREDTQGWCSVLISREIVETVGVPREDLFWWAEDTEYLQWRIPAAGFETERCERAVVEVSRGRADATKPPWKYFYEARNQVWFRLYVQHPEGAIPELPHLRKRIRIQRAARAVVTLATRAVVRERAQRPTKLWMVVRGTFDGVRGRLGRTVDPDEPDRPVTGAPDRPPKSSQRRTK